MTLLLNGTTGVSGVDGSATTPAVQGTDTNTGIFFPAADTVSVSTGGSERMRIDSSGNVGIGTSSPQRKLDIEQLGTDYQIRVGDTGNYYDIGRNTGNGLLTFYGSQAVASGYVFSTVNGERMRIDTSGNVGIGTVSPVEKFEVSAATRSYLCVTGQTYNANAEQGLHIRAYTDATHYSDWYIFQNPVGTSGGLAFTNYINNGGGAVGGERMRIDSSGNLLVGYTNSNGSYKLQVNSQIFATSSTIATSDANYKTNVTPLTGALDLVSKLNPVLFNWKQHPVHDFDTQNTTVGFLAQEVQTALADQTYVNSIIKESEVTLPDKTKEKFLGIAEGNMIAVLVKAIQELSAKVDAQAAEIAELKTKIG